MMDTHQQLRLGISVAALIGSMALLFGGLMLATSSHVVELARIALAVAGAGAIFGLSGAYLLKSFLDTAQKV